MIISYSAKHNGRSSKTSGGRILKPTASIVTLISEKVGFKAKSITCNKEFYLTIRNSDVQFGTLYQCTKLIHKTKIDETTEMDKSMVTVTDFNTPLLRSTRPEKNSRM